MGALAWSAPSTQELAPVHELPAEAALDAEVAAGHVVIGGRGDLDDALVLHVHGQGAADAAVRADGVGRGLARFVPGAGLAQVVLALEHQRACRADADAVAAVDAGGRGQRPIVLGRDAGVEAAPGERDRESVLGILAASLDALVAKDALGVVADIKRVVDLGRLADGRRGGSVRRRSRGRPGWVMVAGTGGVALARDGRRRRRAVALGA